MPVPIFAANVYLQDVDQTMQSRRLISTWVCSPEADPSLLFFSSSLFPTLVLLTDQARPWAFQYNRKNKPVLVLVAFDGPEQEALEGNTTKGTMKLYEEECSEDEALVC